MTLELLHYVEMELPASDGPVLEEMLMAIGLAVSSWHRAESDTAILRVFLENDVEAVQVAGQIAENLPDWTSLLNGNKPVLRTGTMQREDWAESWKKYFHTFRASRRIIVKPSWETFEAKATDVVLELDPGMSFGTGYHGTTRACIEFIDELRDELGPVSFLDVGCGSGILSLAVAKLGFQKLAAFDNDPQAVQVALENLQAAGITDVDVVCSEIADYAGGTGFRLVAANILAHVLLDNAESIAGFVDNSNGPGILILSGILEGQYEQVKSCYEALGLKERQNRVIDEWKSGIFVKH